MSHPAIRVNWNREKKEVWFKVIPETTKVPVTGAGLSFLVQLTICVDFSGLLSEGLT